VLVSTPVRRSSATQAGPDEGEGASMEYGATLFLALVVLVIVTVAGVARRIGVAAPLALVAVGAGLSFLPGAPEIHLEPEWILAIVLPPLLYAAAVNFPLIDFRRNFGPIAALGVALVIVSAVVVGLVLWWLLPQLDLASAIALGAVVSPTDAVSATSIARRVGLPSRIVTILEGESLINDASALVLMRTAVASIAASFDLPRAVGGFLWEAIVAVAIGAVVGVLAVLVRSRFRDPVLTTSVSFVAPFLAYVPAEAAQASGVIAVVTTGLIVGHHSVRTQTAQLRFAEQTNWRTVQFLLENGVFLLMGYQLREYLVDASQDNYGIGTTIVLGLVAVLVLVLVRLGFAFPLFALLARRSRAIAAGRVGPLVRLGSGLRSRAATLRGRRSAREAQRRLARREEADRVFHEREQLGWRSSAVIGWSGMRGVVTVAAVQTLPVETPYRSALILVAFTVAVATLLLGGLTLAPLARRLGVREARAPAAEEIRALFGDLSRSASRLLDDPELSRDDGTPFAPEVVERVAGEVRSQDAVAERSVPSTPAGQEYAQILELRRKVFHAQREALADARATSTYSTVALNVAESILNTLEARATED